ncbi:hypothetical protein BV25DRAFT_1840060 [Artomyces pyxidatus]|uniref:Uncharacterized protein n=1 Tax=Artomyces pyxidatus TaxID=48021 RepID=A0ACB8STT1_9AGAM|nr:hypothetical protein BV25DRAFT_1840060 [Artomyces pyxidatus]
MSKGLVLKEERTAWLEGHPGEGGHSIERTHANISPQRDLRVTLKFFVFQEIGRECRDQVATAAGFAPLFVRTNTANHIDGPGPRASRFAGLSTTVCHERVEDKPSDRTHVFDAHERLTCGSLKNTQLKECASLGSGDGRKAGFVPAREVHLLALAASLHLATPSSQYGAHFLAFFPALCSETLPLPLRLPRICAKSSKLEASLGRLTSCGIASSPSRYTLLPMVPHSIVHDTGSYHPTPGPPTRSALAHVPHNSACSYTRPAVWTEGSNAAPELIDRARAHATKRREAARWIS